MNEKIDLKKVEKQTYRFTFTDGLYDMAYGCLLVFIAIAPILREILYPSYIIFLILPAPLILILGARFITVPRIGIVKFNQNRTKSRNKIGLLIGKSIAIKSPIFFLDFVLFWLNFTIPIRGAVINLPPRRSIREGGKTINSM